MKNLTDLRSLVRGRVLLGGDDDFDQARKPWNAAVDQPVAAVVEAAGPADVAAVVRYAREAGLAVAAQPNGHGAVGGLDGVILLRTGALNTLRVDPGARTARAGAGVAWGQVQAAAGPHGLTGLAGSSPIVSVTGFTLGGGIGWFGRRYGWAADSVTAFEVVDARGDQARVTAGSDADLFWALRGGGGDFALVTAIEFDLHPAPELYGGRQVWPARQAAEVLEAFRQITADAPAELSVWTTLLQVPGGPALVAVDATYLGEAAEGQALLRSLDEIGGRISDSRAVLPIAELGSITAEPTDPSPGRSHAKLLKGLDDEVIKTLLAEPIDPLLSVQIRHLAGAFAQPSDSPHGPLTEPYIMNMFGLPFNPERAAAIDTRQRELAHALAPYTGRRKPFTYLATGDTAADSFGESALSRLQQIKLDRDPHKVIRSNVPVLG